MILGIGMNSQRLLANSEYVKKPYVEKQILKSEHNAADNDGMKKQEILNWSYGKLETLNLFIPRVMGGASDEEGSEEMMKKVQELVQENVTSQEEYDQISKGFGGSLTYWGDQPSNFWTGLSRCNCGIFSHFRIFSSGGKNTVIGF